MPPPRSTTTCNPCRTRKVRCNGGPGPCANCVRLGFQCSLSDNSPLAAPAVRPERKRGSKACVECRAQKIKCSGELPSCLGCQHRGKDCVYPETLRSRNNPRRQSILSARSGKQSAPSDSPGTPETTLSIPSIPNMTGEGAERDSLAAPLEYSYVSPMSFNSEGHIRSHPLRLPPMREQLDLINDFFRHVYPLTAYSFLNQVSFTQRCLDGTLDTPLILALCAITGLHLSYNKYHPVFTSSWIEEAENIIWAHIGHPSVFRTQAALLIVLYRIVTGNFRKAFMLSAIAARSASALRLHYERPDLSVLAQEIRRRLMWCLSVAEGYFAAGLPECDMIPLETIRLRLPCKEEDFNTEEEGHNAEFGSVSLDGVEEDGLLASIIRLAAVRRDVMKLKRLAILSPQPVPRFEAIIDEFRNTLSQIPLPPYSEAELNRYSRSRWFVRYIVAWLSWHQAHCDIYRLFLIGYPEAASQAATSGCSEEYKARGIDLCLQHAESNMAILTDLANLRYQSLVSDPDIAIVGYHTCRILLFISRSPLKPLGYELTPQVASSRATVVLDLLKRLFSIPVIGERITTDLERILQAHDANKSEPRRDSSDLEDESSTTPRIASLAKHHQGLAVHSILRQARFVDDSYATVGGQRSGQNSSSIPEHSQSRQDALHTSFNNSQPNTEFLGINTGSSMAYTPLENVNTVPDDQSMAVAGGFDPWINWADFHVPEEMMDAADGFYF